MREANPEIGFRTYQFNGEPCSEKEFWVLVAGKLSETAIVFRGRTSCCDALLDDGYCCKCRRKIEA